MKMGLVTLLEETLNDRTSKKKCLGRENDAREEIMLAMLW